MSTTNRKRKGKRGNGEGSITQRKDGLWQARVMVGTRTDGAPDHRYVYAKARGECQCKLDDLRKRASGGLLADPGKDREALGAFLTGWLEAVNETVRASTYDGYRVFGEKHLIPGLGRHKWRRFGPTSFGASTALWPGCLPVRSTTCTRACARRSMTPCCGATSPSIRATG